MNDPYLFIKAASERAAKRLRGETEDGIDTSPDAIFGVGPRNRKHELDRVTNRMVTALMRLFPCVWCHTVSHSSSEWKRNAAGERLWRIGPDDATESEIVAAFEDRAALERARAADVRKAASLAEAVASAVHSGGSVAR